MPNVRQVSMSFGAPEFAFETDEDGVFTAANQTYFAAIGDDANEVDYPAASPNVVGVGGTRLKVGSGGAVTETAWGDGGGGPSLYEPLPAYQIGFTTGSRGTPDVAAVADPNTGCAIYDSTPMTTHGATGWTVAGGTSLLLLGFAVAVAGPVTILLTAVAAPARGAMAAARVVRTASGPVG